MISSTCTKDENLIYIFLVFVEKRRNFPLKDRVITPWWFAPIFSFADNKLNGRENPINLNASEWMRNANKLMIL